MTSWQASEVISIICCSRKRQHFSLSGLKHSIIISQCICESLWLNSWKIAIKQENSFSMATSTVSSGVVCGCGCIFATLIVTGCSCRDSTGRRWWRLRNVPTATPWATTTTTAASPHGCFLELLAAPRLVGLGPLSTTSRGRPVTDRGVSSNDRGPHPLLTAPASSWQSPWQYRISVVVIVVGRIVRWCLDVHVNSLVVVVVVDERVSNGAVEMNNQQ